MFHLIIMQIKKKRIRMNHRTQLPDFRIIALKYILYDDRAMYQANYTDRA